MVKMIPGFVNIYKDKEEFIHLYFYNGIDDNEDKIYRDIDLSNVSLTYTCKNDGISSDYKFNNKSIIKIHCELVPFNNLNKGEKKILSI